MTFMISASDNLNSSVKMFLLTENLGELLIHMSGHHTLTVSRLVITIIFAHASTTITNTITTVLE